MTPWFAMMGMRVPQEMPAWQEHVEEVLLIVTIAIFARQIRVILDRAVCIHLSPILHWQMVCGRALIVMIAMRARLSICVWTVFAAVDRPQIVTIQTFAQPIHVIQA